MDRRDKLKSIIFLFILFGVYVFVFGESGVLERMKLNREYKALQERIYNLEYDNRIISDDIKKYSEGLYSDRDIIASGYVKNGGRIIHFTDSSGELPDTSVQDNKFDLELSHLRIIWIIFSIVLIIYYYTKKKGEVDTNHGQSLQ